MNNGNNPLLLSMTRPTRTLLAGLLIGTLTGLCSPPARATTAADIYKTTQHSINQGGIASISSLKTQLSSYQALLPFLEYRLVQRTFATLSDQDVQAFINRHPDAVVSMLARHRLLKRMASNNQWQAFNALVGSLPQPVNLSTTMQCRHFQAQLATGTAISTLDQAIADVWHSGQSLPDSCDPVFAKWYEAGLMSTERALDRVGLAVGKSNNTLARYIAKRYLDNTANSRVEDWIRSRKEPKAVLEKYADALIPLTSVSLVRYALTHAAWTQPDNAPAVLDQWMKRLKLSNQDRDRVVEDLGRRAVAYHKDYASELLDRIAPNYQREDTIERHITAAMREARHERAAQLIEALPGEERSAPRWQYWGARLALRRGDKAGARDVFAALATTRNYYGFLAADRIKQSYQLNDARADASGVDKLASAPAFIMVRALLDANDEHLARRQWAYAIRSLASEDLQSAAVLAHRWQWHDRAIITMAKSGFYDDMDVRFPILHRDIIKQSALHHGLNPAWILGVIRQESAFVADARSSVGALGLMQLMPATGKRVGKRLGLKVRTNNAILEHETNIQLGSAYLRELIDQCGHPALATASYNAGPHRARRWLPDSGDMDAELWIETIPYRETRGFVKNVLAFTAVYEQRLGRKYRRLQDKLAPVSAGAC